MFDLSWSHLLVVAVVALIAIGPKELPSVLRNVGHWMGKIRRMAAEFQTQFQEAMREAEMEDLKKHADDLNNAARSLTKPLDPTDYLGKLDAPPTSASTATPATPSETVPSLPQPDPEGDTAANALAEPLPKVDPEPAAPATGAAGAGGRSA
jgi:sec-independent protein translocase protein TatB